VGAGLPACASTPASFRASPRHYVNRTQVAGRSSGVHLTALGGSRVLPAARAVDWEGGRTRSAVQRVVSAIQGIANWSLSDTLSTRAQDISAILSTHIFSSGNNAGSTGTYGASNSQYRTEIDQFDRITCA